MVWMNNNISICQLTGIGFSEAANPYRRAPDCR